MPSPFLEEIPVLNSFGDVADPAHYVPLPADWVVGVSDVVDSTGHIAGGNYKAVNLAGAGTISAVGNAIGGRLPLFVFGGDGAHFALPPEDADAAREALARAAMWADRDLSLDLRVALLPVADVRAAGHDIRVAFWQASPDVRYAMFSGGGLDWAEDQLKAGAIGIPPAAAEAEPDLTGLSCQWGPIRPSEGRIASLIVKRHPTAEAGTFRNFATDLVAIIDETTGSSPVPDAGPDVRWPKGTIALQARIARRGMAGWVRRCRVLLTSALMWLVFKTGIRVGRFRPDDYRREIARNTDFRKFDDGLMMTVDCTPEVAAELRARLTAAQEDGIIHFGMHEQDEALMTCVVPSALSSDHVHFVDGAGGGYAEAARQMKAAMAA